MTRALFFEPKPRQLHSAASMACGRPWFGMKSRSHAGSASCWLMVGGRKSRAIASAAVTTPAAPLAPWGCPIIDLTDETTPRVDLKVSAEHKHDFVARESNGEMQVAVDRALDKVIHQLRRYKEKIQDHRRTPHVGDLPAAAPTPKVPVEVRTDQEN